MRVEYSRKFLKAAARLPKHIVELAEKKDALFRDNPFNPSLGTHKLHGKEKDLRAFWINQKYRIKFLFLDANSVLFVDVGTHDIYS